MALIHMAHLACFVENVLKAYFFSNVFVFLFLFAIEWSIRGTR